MQKSYNNVYRRNVRNAVMTESNRDGKLGAEIVIVFLLDNDKVWKVMWMLVITEIDLYALQK